MLRVCCFRRAYKAISVLSRPYVQTGRRLDLVSAFDSSRSTRKSQSSQSTGLLGLQELTSHEGFDVLAEAVIQRGAQLADEAIKARTIPTTCVELCDELSDEICRVADMSECMRLLHPDPHYRESAKEACIKISNFVEKLNTNLDLYKTLKEIVTDAPCLDPDTLRVAELLLVDFEQSGIHLSPANRLRAVQLSDKALSEAIAFGDGCSGNWNRLSLKETHPSANVREKAFKVYNASDGDQIHLLKQLVGSRQQLATLCGYGSFADLALGGSMAGSPARARAFLTQASRELKPDVEVEIRELLELKSENERRRATRLEPWDLSYYMSVRQSRDSLSRESGFSLGKCMEGVSRLLGHLYGIQLEVRALERGESWCEDGVVKLGVVHEREGELGIIYCDLMSRFEKRAHDCHFTLRGGRHLADSYRNPVVVLNCNFPPRSPLFSVQLDTLLHETGHAMHSMLARTRYQHVTGTRCATDAAEIPSHLMEKFAQDDRVLGLFAGAGHEEFISKSRRNAIEMQFQIIDALTDLQLHSENAPDVDPVSIYRDNLLAHFPLCCSGMEYRVQRFTHFSSHGARYYSYLWAQSVTNLLWKRLFAENPFSREAGELYRERFLSHGGAKDPSKLLADTLGYEPKIEELVESLVYN